MQKFKPAKCDHCERKSMSFSASEGHMCVFHHWKKHRNTGMTKKQYKIIREHLDGTYREKLKERITLIIVEDRLNAGIISYDLAEKILQEIEK